MCKVVLNTYKIHNTINLKMHYYIKCQIYPIIILLSHPININQTEDWNL